MIEYRYLNPVTLEEDPNGQRYSIETLGSSTIISACPEVVAPTEPIAPQPTLEEQIAQLKEDNLALKEDNLIIMDVLATMYEDMLAKGTV